MTTNNNVEVHSDFHPRYRVYWVSDVDTMNVNIHDWSTYHEARAHCVRLIEQDVDPEPEISQECCECGFAGCDACDDEYYRYAPYPLRRS